MMRRAVAGIMEKKIKPRRCLLKQDWFFLLFMPSSYEIFGLSILFTRPGTVFSKTIRNHARIGGRIALFTALEISLV